MGPGSTVMHHVGITVEDLEMSRRWYAHAFAMTVEFEFVIAELSMRGVVLRAPSGFGVELISRAGGRRVREFGGPTSAALVLGYTHFAVEVTDLPVVHASLLGCGRSSGCLRSSRSSRAGGCPSWRIPRAI